jgi:hypothetical protein
VTKRRPSKRRHTCAAWLAIVALLIDGLLPSAVSAARPAAARALCSTAAGDHLPGKPAPGLPPRHCALCAGVVAGLLPSRPGGLVARLLAGAAHPAMIAPAAADPGRPDYAAAQPRAPPIAA